MIRDLHPGITGHPEHRDSFLILLPPIGSIVESGKFSGYTAVFPYGLRLLCIAPAITGQVQGQSFCLRLDLYIGFRHLQRE